MKLYPRWILLLAGISLLPVLLIPFYLFGGLHPFGTSQSTVVSLLLYVLTNLLWAMPVVLFFVSLDQYGRGRRTLAVALAVAGACLTALAAGLVLAAL